MDIVISFCGLCVLVTLGKLLRAKIRFIQRLYIPSSVIAGILGLIIIQTSGEHLSPGWIAGWSRLPGFLINIVFAALFMVLAICLETGLISLSEQADFFSLATALIYNILLFWL